MIQGPVKAAHEPLCLIATKMFKHEPRVKTIDIPAAEGKVVDVAASSGAAATSWGHDEAKKLKV
jgi:hypothetical protein